MRLAFFTMTAVVSTLSAPLCAQTPVVDYHQHLFSPAAAALVTGNPGSPGISAKDVIALLDSAHIQRALVLSVAYTWGKASRAPVANEYEHVKSENDWTAQQVAQYPDRLRAFCSFNPLKAYALEELERCSKDPQLHNGLKLHFGNSDVDLDNPDNVAQVRKVFEAANKYQMPIVVHMHTSIDKHRNYGAGEARTFLNELLPAAPNVPVQIAHLTGSGGYDDATDAALGVFADAITRHDARMKNVWFDAAVVVQDRVSDDQMQQVAKRIRQIGVDRVLYGSDAATNPPAYPKSGWAAFRRLPLSDAEFRVIANNITPYMRDVGPTSTSTLIDFLLKSSAADFHAHAPPSAARFRKVHVGYVTSADGTRNYRLCGEFLSAHQSGKSEWTPFVTIKTSGYEQYLGAQASDFCKRSKVMWDKRDFSSALQSRFGSLK